MAHDVTPTKMLTGATNTTESTSSNQFLEYVSKYHSFYSSNDEGFCVTRPALGRKRRPLTVSVQSFMDHTHRHPFVSLEAIDISSCRVKLPTANAVKRPCATDTSQGTAIKTEPPAFGSERSHKCKHCPRAFILKANLETHMKIHGVIESDSDTNSVKSTHIRAQELKKIHRWHYRLRIGKPSKEKQG